MSVLDKLQIVTPDGAINFYDLDPHKGIITLGQPAGYDPSLGIPLAVPFQILINLQKKPSQVKVLSARTPARLNGQVLSTNRYFDFTDMQTLEVDGYTLLFLENTDIPAPAYAFKGQPLVRLEELQGQPVPGPVRAPEGIPVVIPASLRQPLPETPRPIGTMVGQAVPDDADPNMIPPDIRDDNIIARLSANYWTVDVEQAASCEVEIRNNFKQTASFEVRVEGKENDIDEWTINISPRIINLNNNDTKTVKVSITPPRKPSSAAGPHPLAFIVTSPEFPSNRCQLGAMLVIKPYYQFNVEKLSPLHQIASWFNPTKNASFYINNLGNSRANFAIQSSDDESNALIKFPLETSKAPVQLREVTVEPRSEPYQVPLLITPQHRPALVGSKPKQFKYTVTTISQDNPAISQPLSGTVTSNPVLGRFFILAMLILMEICLVGGAFLALQPRIDSFRVANAVIHQGESADLRWQVSPFTTNVKIDGVADPISGSQGQISVVPATSASTYTLIAGNWLSRMLRMEDLRSQPVNVLSIPPYPEIVTLTVDRSVVFQSDAITVKWSVNNADSAALTVEGVTTTLTKEQLNGEQKYQLKGDTLVILTAKNNSGTVTRSEFVRARPIKIIINNFTVSQKQIVKGDPVTIAWDVSGEGIQSVTISPFKDALPQTGSLQFFPQVSTEFVLTVTARDQQEIRLLSVGVEDKIVPTAPSVDIFKASPKELPVGGGSVEFSWSVSGQTTNIQISGKDGVLATGLPAQGFRTFNVTATANFLMVAYNGTLSHSLDAAVTVAQAKRKVNLQVTNILPKEGNVIRRGTGIDVYVSILADNGSANGVPPASLGWPEITGDVKINDGLNDCTIDVATTSHCVMTINQFPLTVPGPTVFTASYGGDTNYDVKTSPSKSITFIYEANSVIFKPTFSSNPIFTGQPFTLQIDVTPADDKATAPVTGDVVVKQGTNAFCTINLGALPGNPLAGTGSCSVHPTLPIAPDVADKDIALTMTYLGDSTYKSAVDQAIIHVNRAPTLITSPSTFPGTRMYEDTIQVGFSVAVQPGKGSGTPTGSVVRVSDKDNLNNFCEGTLLANGSGSCGLILKNLGTRHLIFTYSGDSWFLSANLDPAPSIDVTVVQADTTAVVTSVTNPTVWEVGQKATIAYTVTANNTTHTIPPTGTVTVNQVSALTKSINSPSSTSCSGTLDNLGNGSCVITLEKAMDVRFTAQFNGDQQPPVNFKASPVSAQYPAPPASNTVKQAQTTTTILSIIPSSPSIAGNVVVKYSVAAARVDSFLQPSSGTVQVFLNGLAICTNTFPTADNSCTVPTSQLGLNKIKVSYSGSTDLAFAGSSTPDTDYVVKQPTTVTISTLTPGLVVDQPVTFNVSITSGGTYGAITGTIAVSSSSGETCSVIPITPPTTTYSCSLTFTTATASPRTITATYDPGAPFYYSGNTGTVAYSAAKDTPTITAFSNSPGTSVVGQPVIVSFTVSQQFTTQPPTPTGTVTVTTDGSETCQTTNLSNGLGSCQLTFIHGGSRSITVSYDGTSSNRYNSASQTYSGVQTVSQANTTTTLTTNPGPIAVGQSVTFTATVSVDSPGGGLPGGKVSFTATQSGSPDLTCLNVTVTGGVATCVLKFPKTGSWSTQAVYTPDLSGDFKGSTSNSINKTVDPANTITTVAGVPSPSVLGQSVAFTATVTTNPPSTITPEGQVAITATLNGSTQSCTKALTGGQGTCSLTLNTVGVWKVTAVYSPSADFIGSTSVSINQTVTNISTSIAITAGPTPLVVGKLVTFTATVSPDPPATDTPVGKVSFTVSSAGFTTQTCLDQTLNGSGQATCPLTIGDAATWHVAVAYTPTSASFNPSIGAGDFVFNRVSTSLSISPNPTGITWYADQTTSFSFTLTYSSSLTPTGTLTLTATPSGSGTLSSCSKTPAAPTGCSITIDAAGTWTLVATYGGDSHFQNSSMSTVTISVSKTTPGVNIVLPMTRSGNNLSVTVLVTGTTPNLTKPTGKVDVAIQGQPTYTCTTGNLDASGNANCSIGGINNLPSTTYTVIATYRGDDNFTNPPSPPQTIVLP